MVNKINHKSIKYFGICCIQLGIYMICSKTSKIDKQDQFDLSSLHSIVLTYVVISFYSILSTQKSGQLSWLERPSGNHEVMSSNPTVSNRIFCNFFTLALSFPFLFPCLPKGIFPFPSNLRQPQLSSYGKCREKPGIMKSGLDAKPLFLQDRLLNYIGV